jgi:hypothetical protein
VVLRKDGGTVTGLRAVGAVNFFGSSLGDLAVGDAPGDFVGRDHIHTARQGSAPGSGKIRGIYCEDNAAVAPIFRQWLEPFAGSRTA